MDFIVISQEKRSRVIVIFNLKSKGKVDVKQVKLAVVLFSGWEKWMFLTGSILNKKLRNLKTMKIEYKSQKE